MNIDTLESTLLWHLKKYPRMQIQDVYKLLYQAVMGAEHLLHGSALQRLQTEWDTLPSRVDEPLFESIAVDSTEIGRLNLRPAKQHGYDVEWVWDVFSRSANEMRADHQQFVAVWEHVVQDLRKWQNIANNDALLFDKEMAAAGYPVMHHSPAYRDAYYPAYRVVNKRYLNMETFDE